jgi:peptidyl-prolyl cis-trans isomerase B (cyclophilin B)
LARKSKDIEASALRSLKQFEQKQNLEDTKAQTRVKDNRLAIIATASTFVLALASQFVYFTFGPGISPTACITFSQTPVPNTGAQPGATVPDASLAECRDWTGTMQLNNTNLQIKLFGAKAPQAVANFVDLSSMGFYTDISCHRLTTSGIYVLQCGDPRGDGTGDPGYTWGPLENAPVAAKEGEAPIYTKGMLAMARTSNSGSSMGSQFFIVYKDSPIPNDAAGGYTVFGEITAGLTGLNSIIDAGVKDGSNDGKPKVTTSIKSITVK